MVKLCFGSYAMVLKTCKASPITQQNLVLSLLRSVCSNFYIQHDDYRTVHSLIHGHSNIPTDVKVYVEGARALEVADYFRENIIPLLDPNQWSNIILALKDILAADTTIIDACELELVNHHTKSEILTRDSFVLADLLAGIFLYIARYTDNRGQEESIRAITDEYIHSFDSRRDEITFIRSYTLSNNDAVSAAAVEARKAELATEQRGDCPYCGKTLVPENSLITDIGDDEEMLLCASCSAVVQSSGEHKGRMRELKALIRERLSAREAADIQQLTGDIPELLLRIRDLDPSGVTLRALPLKVEQKIADRQLQRKVKNNVVDGMYEAINDCMDQLAGEDRLNVRKFAKGIRRLYEDVSETLTDQSEVFRALVSFLYTKTGQKNYEACEVLISYFVQSCEVFDEITE